MPQFVPANFLPQFVWLVAAFAILYFLIVQATLPRLGRTIAAREGKVSGDIDAAQQAKTESDRVHQAYEAEMAEAHASAAATVAEAQAEVTKETEAKLAEANAGLHAKADAAAAQLEAARGAALVEIERIAAEAAAAIVARLSGEQPDESSARAAVRDALAA